MSSGINVGSPAQHKPHNGGFRTATPHKQQSKPLVKPPDRKEDPYRPKVHFPKTANKSTVDFDYHGGRKRIKPTSRHPKVAEQLESSKLEFSKALKNVREQLEAREKTQDGWDVVPEHRENKLKRKRPSNSRSVINDGVMCDTNPTDQLSIQLPKKIKLDNPTIVQILKVCSTCQQIISEHNCVMCMKCKKLNHQSCSSPGQIQMGGKIWLCKLCINGGIKIINR